MKKTKRIAYGGVVSGLSLVFLLLSAVFPFAEYACPAIAGVTLIALVLEFRKKTAYLAYAVVSLLALFIVPNRESAVLFIAFLGYYPILKSTLEQLRSRTMEWVLKILLFNAAAAAGYAALIFIFGMTEILSELHGALVYGIILAVLANITFVIYDIALTRLIAVYQLRFAPRIKKALYK